VFCARGVGGGGRTRPPYALEHPMYPSVLLLVRREGTA